MLNIVLVHPDIPQNTGNVARLCVGLEATLHLVHPMSFVLDDRKVKRAGLDYWPHLKLEQHASLAEFLTKVPRDKLHLVETGGTKTYTDAQYKDGDWLVLGAETVGLPKDLLASHSDRIVTIPMPGQVRSLNVSNSAAVVAYEAYRQIQKGLT